MQQFGQRIKELRIEHSMTQKQLAAQLHVRNTTVSAWEASIAEPPYETLAQIARMFGVTTDYLLGLED